MLEIVRGAEPLLVSVTPRTLVTRSPRVPKLTCAGLEVSAGAVAAQRDLLGFPAPSRNCAHTKIELVGGLLSATVLAVLYGSQRAWLNWVPLTPTRMLRTPDRLSG